MKQLPALGRASHVAASDFAKLATAGNPATALNALQGITGTCVACHRSYRTQ